MSAIEAIVLGLVQGLTEFLPISSSAHLRILPALFGWEDPGAGFSAVIQLGTMAAVLLYFRRDLWRIALSWTHELRLPFRQKSREARLGWFIILATIPISFFGLVFKDQIESSARALLLIGCALIVFSCVMLIAERIGSKRRTLTATNLGDAVGARGGAQRTVRAARDREWWRRIGRGDESPASWRLPPATRPSPGCCGTWLATR